MLQQSASSTAAFPLTPSASASTISSTTASDSVRRRSTFYVPLINDDNPVISSNPSGTTDLYSGSYDRKSIGSTLSAAEMHMLELQRSLERLCNSNTAEPEDWSLESMISSDVPKDVNRNKRYGVVLNGLNLDDDDGGYEPPQRIQSITSTPIKLMKSRSRTNILNLPERQQSATSSQLTTPIKEKSKTLPQNMSPINLFPAQQKTFLMKSSPKIALDYSASDSHITGRKYSDTGVQQATPSPKKSLSFIRRAHSTKLSRSNSLLKSLTSNSKTSSSSGSNSSGRSTVTNDLLNGIDLCDLQLSILDHYYKMDNCWDLIKELFFGTTAVSSTGCDSTTPTKQSNVIQSNTTKPNDKEDDGIHSDTSYEKACRRGSAPVTPILSAKNQHNNQNENQTTSRFTNFFSKRSFRSNPLKRTKSVTKLERSKRPGGLRGSRSHESLLSGHAVMQTIDLSCTGAVAVAPVHQSVLGRRHCFQVRGGPRGERYYSCGSRQERDLWIYSLRKSIAPNAEHTRHTDNSLKMWIFEGKELPAKKRYFCEINLDKTLYGRTSVKLKTDLLFWGEYFDFPDIPDINVITVNVYREGEKKKKRDKHTLVGSVKISIHEVTSRSFSENWYQIISEKHDSISRNSSKEQIPTLRIKCRFQSIDILPISVYHDFLGYLKDNYRTVCETLEPVIGVKAKEDIGQALVLLMHAQGMAGAFLTDVVASDLLRVDDQRLTFRGNSLATKSMEAFLKLIGEQYLQDTLYMPISEIISSDRDCEVDPQKASGSLTRQRQALQNAVRIAWNSIAESHKHFPPQLRDCFATFRERLRSLKREDMADNLISGSIFLRFLCPAILSPSLFNITSEFPSPRANRNLTLVAKTLQTLANFTRFQAKENFMEFLNDFLELEAPRMKQFLHEISARKDGHQSETILDWSGYIDQGKQLSILHSLLSESIQKLPPGSKSELAQLTNIMDAITKAKETNVFGSQLTLSLNGTNGNQENCQPQNGLNSPIVRNDRGIMRGVLTPTSLEKNIFRYNDPTVSPLLNQTSNLRHSQSSIAGSNYSQPIHHSQSATSLASMGSRIDPYNKPNHHINPKISVLQYGSNNVTVNGGGDYDELGSSQPMQQQPSQNHRNYNTTSSYYSTQSSGRRSPAMRANTLPRNNGIPQVSMVEVNPENELNANLIQIGLDPSNAFVRKSPTPMLKSSSHSRHRTLNGSQQSLIGDRSPITHQNMMSILNNHSTHNQQPKIPMNLEDLEDLFKYGEEHENVNTKQSNGKHIGKGCNGSNISIGHCSSGYQSIATQSQSSSPVDLAQQRIDFMNKNLVDESNGNNKYKSISSRGKEPLAFKNPLYHMQNTDNHHHNGSSQPSNSQKSSSLTPSSSEEHLSNENYCSIDGDTTHPIYGKSVNGNQSIDKARGMRKEKNGNTPRWSSSMQNSNGRMPRTNPLVQYKANDFNMPIGLPLVKSESTSNYHSNHNPHYHRRQSLDTAKVVCDSSSDTEGSSNSNRKVIESKRRRPRVTERNDRYDLEMFTRSLDNQIRDLNREHNGDPHCTDLVTAPRHTADYDMQTIITRLMSMEEECKREHMKMSMALSQKQRVIEAQGQQIAALDAANNRLLSTLSILRQRYEDQQQQQSHGSQIRNGTGN